jgi:predicted Zn-dependent peptidase
VLAGDVDVDRAFTLAERDFGDWPRGPDPFAAHPVPAQPALQADVTDVINAPVHGSDLIVAFQGPSTRDDFRGAVAADVLATISGVNGQAFRRILGEDILGAGISHWASPQKGVLGLGLKIASGHESAAIDALDVMHFWLKTITREQIDAAKDVLWTQRFQAQDVDLTLAHALSADWAMSGASAAQDYLETLYGIEQADLERLMARYVTDQPRAAVLVTNPDNGHFDVGAALRAAW